MNYDDRRSSSPLTAILPWVLLLAAGYMLYSSWSKQRKPQLQAARNLRVQPARNQVQRAQRGSRFVQREIDPNAVAEPRAVTPRGQLQADEHKTINLFRDHTDSVVNIKATVQAINRVTMNVTDIPRGTGTGFMWDAEGHIVTNFHVIDEADKAQIILADQSSYMAKLVGGEPDKDIAVLKIDAPLEKLRALPIGRSSDLEVGQNVYAIGNPFGFDQTLTTGIISGLGREIKAKNNRRITGMIQTDAAINPGNSGGPLLDSAGRLIGVNTAIFSPSGAYAGIGFAIPVDTVNRIVPQLIKFGRVIDKPRLGIIPAPDAFLRRRGLKGVLVLEVLDGSTAQNFGIEPTQVDDERTVVGDIIVGVNENPVGSVEQLLDELDQFEIGDATTITVIRGAGGDEPREVTLEGRLKSAPAR